MKKLVFCLLIVILTIGCGKQDNQSDGMNNNPIPVSFWHWSGERVITSEEQKILEDLGTTNIFVFRGLITENAKGLQFAARGGKVTVHQGIKSHIVFRIDPALASRLVENNEDISAFIASQFKNYPASKGLQLDCDTPTSKISKYATFLKNLRLQLPEGTELSVTMLLDWLNSKALKELMNAVDFIIPQFYTTELPESVECNSLVFGGNIKSAIETLERYDRPYMIGLPTFRRSAIFDSSGKLMVASASLSESEAITQGGTLKRHFQGNDENVIVFEMPDNKTVLIGRPGVKGLAARIQEVRSANGGHCVGICFYRLPCPGETDIMSFPLINAAIGNTIRSVDIKAELRQNHSYMTLLLSNASDEDFIDFQVPATIKVSAGNGKVSSVQYVPGTEIWNLEPSFNGLLCAPHRANGVNISCPLLLAGQTLKITGLTLDMDSTDENSAVEAVISYQGRSRTIEVINEKRD